MGRIVVEYQPIVDIRTGYPVGAEALVRIRDLKQRLMLPGLFLEVAEETGLLIKIDEVVLADAVKLPPAAWEPSSPASPSTSRPATWLTASSVTPSLTSSRPTAYLPATSRSK